MEAATSGPDPLPPAEADCPPELLRLPAPTPPPAMDDSQFLGSIMGEASAPKPPAQLGVSGTAPVGPKKRGRPPKKRDGAALPVTAPAKSPAAKRREDQEEVVCFICFDGGNLVLCDRRGCPKVYHPACIKCEESFFNSRTKWNCGWHICSSCEKAVHYMCYTCTYSLCKVCIKQGKFFSVRGTKGFCDICFGTILLIESQGEADTKVDFDDINTWEYLFKLYWLDLKGKLSLTIEELTSAKSRWTVPNTSTRKEKEESSNDLYDINNDDDAGSDCSSRKRRRNSSRKKGQKRQKLNSNCSTTTTKPLNSNCSVGTNKAKSAIKDAGSVATKVPTEGVSFPVDTKWASPELLEFVGHMRDGDQSYISQFDVQTDLLEYIKKNNLRDPQRKSQIICDARLHRLFRKTRVAHFEMLKLLEMHFLVNDTSKLNDNSQAVIDLNSAQVDTNGYSDMSAKLSPDKRRKFNRRMEREAQVNPEAYAAVDMHNINLIYMRRSLVEDLIDDASFLVKIYGAFVRIKISGVGQKQDMYRLVKVVGTHNVPEKYTIGKKATNLALEILNLDKKEIITMDTISNQDFTEEECNRLRQSMKCGVISRLKVGAIQEKAKVLQSVRVTDLLENEKQRLEHLRDRASETGRKKELRDCVEKLQLFNNSEERTRWINEVLEVHVDPHMDPNYESAEEMDDKKSVGAVTNQTRTETSVSRRKSKYPNSTRNHTLKIVDANHHPKKLSVDSTIQGSRTGTKLENFHHANDTGIRRPSTMCEAGSVSSSVLTVSSEMEPEKVWHYKDPSGNVQGPFTLLQLSKWTSYFPRDLRVWLTFESEDRSLLLTEVLSKQHTVFTQATSVTASTKATPAVIDCNKNSPSVDQINALSPSSYSMLNSSVVTVQSKKLSIPERENVNSPEDCLSLSTSSVPPKDVHTLNRQVQGQAKHSIFVQSPGNSCGQTDLPHDGAHGGCSGESNHHHSSIAVRSPITLQMACNGKSNATPHHHNQHTLWSQNQNDSTNSSQKDLSKNLPAQRVGKDFPSPLFAWSPAESRTASSQHDGSCLSSTNNPNFLDEHHSPIASAKHKCCNPASPIEDRGSSSPSGMLSHSERVPVCSPQSAPSASVSDMYKIEENMNQQRTLEGDTSNASVNQSPESKIFPVSSPDNQGIDHKFPSPTPGPENKEPVSDNSGVLPESPEKLATTYSPVSDPCKIEEIVNQHKIHRAGALNSLANHDPQFEVFHESCSDGKDLEPESLSATARSVNKKPPLHNSHLTSAVTENLRTASSDAETCKMEATVDQQKTVKEDLSNASINRSPSSNIFPASSNDNDIECIYPSSTLRSGNKEPSMDKSGLNSAVPENSSAITDASNACKIEVLDKKVTIETDASNGSITPSKVSLVSYPDNLDIEHEFPGPAPKYKNKDLLVDYSVLKSAVHENETTSVSASDGCKMETPGKNTTLETDASNGSPSKVSLMSYPDKLDIEHEFPVPAPKSENKEPLVDNLVLTSALHENDTTISVSASDGCKVEEMPGKKITLETDASNDSTTPSKVSLMSYPDNLDIEHEFPGPAPKSENKEPLVDNLALTSAVHENGTTTYVSASDGCKMEEMPGKKTTLEIDASNGSITPSKVSLVSSPDNLDIELEFTGPAPKSENKEPIVENSVLTSAVRENGTTTSVSASHGCKMEMLGKTTTLETDVSNGFITPSKVSLVSSPDNLDIEHEFPGPAPKFENKELLVDNSVLTSAVHENEFTTSVSASGGCKMEVMPGKKTTLETDVSKVSVSTSHRSEDFPVSSDSQDIQCEYPIPTPRPGNNKPVVSTTMLVVAAPENLTAKVPGESPNGFVLPMFEPPTGKLDTMESEFKGAEEISQNELYSESTVVTRENVVIDPSRGAESIDVSDVLESLMEQRCGPLYMHGTSALEDFLATSAEDGPQCSSPIALSPWGEPSYHQGDAVDSTLWGVEDDPMNNMWSLLSPTPTLQPSSGLGTEESGTFDINEVPMSCGINEFLQRGLMPGEENVTSTISGAATNWVLPEQVKSKPNDVSASSADECTGIVGWQMTANQNLTVGTSFGTSHNLYLPSCVEAVTSSKSSWEASRKQESTDSIVSSSGEVTGNTNKSWNPPSVNANRENQKNHRRSRYSEINESWLLSSNNSRSRSDRFGNGGSSRSNLNGQTRGVCKFHEGGYCSKGASCSYLHP